MKSLYYKNISVKYYGYLVVAGLIGMHLFVLFYLDDSLKWETLIPLSISLPMSILMIRIYSRNLVEFNVASNGTVKLTTAYKEMSIKISDIERVQVLRKRVSAKSKRKIYYEAGRIYLVGKRKPIMVLAPGDYAPDEGYTFLNNLRTHIESGKDNN